MKPTKIQKVDEPQFSDIRKWFDENLDAEHIDVEDQEVYENVYHKGRWAAVFQFTEGGAQRFAVKAKPRSITDIAAITSIYRPGPLQANVDKLFVEAKEKLERGEELEFDHPIIKDVLGETYGYMIFQESFMLLGRDLGKLSWEDCDRLRKVLVKKSIGQDANDEKAQEAERIRVKFVKGATENGLTEDKANELWETMKKFNGYGFNKSLAADTRVNVYSRLGKLLAQKQVVDVSPDEFLLTRDESTGRTQYTRVVANHNHGKQRLYRYVLDNGATVECTEDHKFRTTCGQMLPIKDIERKHLEICADYD